MSLCLEPYAVIACCTMMQPPTWSCPDGGYFATLHDKASPISRTSAPHFPPPTTLPSLNWSPCVLPLFESPPGPAYHPAKSYRTFWRERRPVCEIVGKYLWSASPANIGSDFAKSSTSSYSSPIETSPSKPRGRLSHPWLPTTPNPNTLGRSPSSFHHTAKSTLSGPPLLHPSPRPLRKHD